MELRVRRRRRLGLRPCLLRRRQCRPRQRIGAGVPRRRARSRSGARPHRPEPAGRPRGQSRLRARGGETARPGAPRATPATAALCRLGRSRHGAAAAGDPRRHTCGPHCQGRGARWSARLRGSRRLGRGRGRARGGGTVPAADPRGASSRRAGARERILDLTGSLQERPAARTLVLEPEAAADALLSTLAEWGELPEGVATGPRVSAQDGDDGYDETEAS